MTNLLGKIFGMILIGSAGVLVFILLCTLTGLIMQFAWNGTMPGMFPRLAELGIPMQITWRQGFCFSLLLGLIGNRFKTEVNTK